MQNALSLRILSYKLDSPADGTVFPSSCWSLHRSEVLAGLLHLDIWGSKANEIWSRETATSLVLGGHVA